VLGHLPGAFGDLLAKVEQVLEWIGVRLREVEAWDNRVKTRWFHAVVTGLYPLSFGEK
jgi:hypothetical protein